MKTQLEYCFLMEVFMKNKHLAGFNDPHWASVRALLSKYLTESDGEELFILLIPAKWC